MATLPLGFLAKVILISASGALSPGPLTVAVATLGFKRGYKGGIVASLGHTLAEFPLVLCLALGLSTVINDLRTKLVVSLVGGSSLIAFGILQFLDAIKSAPNSVNSLSNGSSLVIGFTLTLFNPFFLIWWLSIGLSLVTEAIMLMQLVGVLVLYLAHVWLDYFWLTLVAYLASLGKRSTKISKLVAAALSLAMIPLGINMLYYAVKLLHLP